MNSKHRKTLRAVFANPVPASLEWRRIEALLLELGAQRFEGRGSRVAFILDGRRADFHRPHPGNEAKPYQVRDVRAFLLNVGVKP